ncbi:MAG: preprotein translocase subunit SecA, partial [Candidatus Endobugula sp.]
MSDLNFRPGVRSGAYPQQETKLSGLKLICYRLYQRIKAQLFRILYRQRYVVGQVNRYRQALALCTEDQLTEAIEDLRAELHKQGIQNQLIFKAFAVIRETSKRTLGKTHFDVQLFGGWIMINGKLAEMETGEGKTLTTTLPACTAALAGIPVHVITANDYLASRDADTMAPLYQRLGLQVSSVVEGMGLDQRRKNYQANIVHTTNKQIAFDYLRDRIAMTDDTGPLRLQFCQIRSQLSLETSSQPLLRGLCFALVDEADSVLIDEAKTPLIITKTTTNHMSAENYTDALYLASALLIDYDYKVDNKNKMIAITTEGEDSLAELALTLPTFWHNPRHAHRLVKQALTAKLFYKNDQHYTVLDNKIQIIDGYTGRRMTDRSWEQGLHQMIEAKEGCTISASREPLARISYQRFFSRYLYLGGASGTLSDVSTELQRAYGLDVVKVATHRPSKRKVLTERLFRDEEAKKQALLKRIKQLYQQQRPILIGTSSVEESEQVGSWLEQEHIPHLILNAKQDEQEASIITQAGQLQAVTVATNMAGRGTDITLAARAATLGGLHVIALSRNNSRRVDRQLYGRCARQGDPGSVEAILSLEDPALVNYYSSTILKLLNSLTSGASPLPLLLTKWILRL